MCGATECLSITLFKSFEAEVENEPRNSINRLFLQKQQNVKCKLGPVAMFCFVYLLFSKAHFCRFRFVNQNQMLIGSAEFDELELLSYSSSHHLIAPFNNAHSLLIGLGSPVIGVIGCLTN